MDRLTKRVGSRYGLNEYVSTEEAIKRLGQYEDTGCTPHQVDQMKEKKKIRVQELKEEAERIDEEWRKNHE